MEQPTSNLFELQIDPQSQSYLGETAKWAKFIAIVSFIFAFIFLSMMFGVSAYLSTVDGSFGGDSGIAMMGAGYMISIMVLMILLIVIPNVFLIRFAIRMQGALRNNDQPSLMIAFRNLKSCYKFVGIYLIVVIALWILGLVFGVLNDVSRIG